MQTSFWLFRFRLSIAVVATLICLLSPGCGGITVAVQKTSLAAPSHGSASGSITTTHPVDVTDDKGIVRDDGEWSLSMVWNEPTLSGSRVLMVTFDGIVGGKLKGLATVLCNPMGGVCADVKTDDAQVSVDRDAGRIRITCRGRLSGISAADRSRSEAMFGERISFDLTASLPAELASGL